MSLFGNHKLKVKSTLEEDKVKNCIIYYKVKNSAAIKSSLIKELIGTTYCLATINTNMLYQNENTDKDDIVTSLINSLDKLNIKYSKKVTTKDNNMKLLGVTVSMNSKKTRKDYIIGFAFKADELEDMYSLINNYTLHYYIATSQISKEELLNKFDLTYFDEEELLLNFDYDILDSNYLEQIVITSTQETSILVHNIVDKLNQAIK